MLRGSKPLTLHQAQTYYTREYARGDYYTAAATAPPPAGAAPGTWQGEGAASLGLCGAIDRATFQSLLAGRLGGLQLVAPAAATGVHRAAWDFQVAPDKTVSLVALAGGDERLLAAHHAAAAQAFAILERHAETRDRSRRPVRTGNLVTARFDHDTSRALDPQLHSHHVILNLTRRPDGAWRALESRSLFGAQALATATYHLELARHLQALGYPVSVDARGHVRIAGIPEPARAHFSRRRRAILAELARPAGTRDPQQAALKTRRPKDHDVDPAALRRAWAEAARHLGLDFAALRREADRRRGEDPAAGSPLALQNDPEARGQAAQRSVAWAVRHLEERHAVFTTAQLELAALRHATGRGPTAADIRQALTAAPGVARAGGDRLTTHRALRLETANLTLLQEAAADLRPPISTTPLHAPDLTPDQLRAARHILESRAQILAVEGRPGTGKTFTLARVREVARQHGWTVRAFAVTTGAVAELHKAGLDAATVRSLAARTSPASRTPADSTSAAPAPPVAPAARRELWIVDEAGLLASRDAHHVLLQARRAGARLVLVGDRGQHHAVGAGKPFVDLQRAGLTAVRLDTIRRQHDPVLLAAVQLAAAGRAAQAVQHLDRHGHLSEIPQAAARHQAMAHAYLAAPRDTLMIAPSHAERTALNRLTRDLLVDRGRLSAQGLTVEIATSRGLTGAQRADARSYRPGDLVTFHRAAPAHGIVAGETARVLRVDADRHQLTVHRLQPPPGAAPTLTYDPRRLRGGDLARAERRDLAPGDRIVFRQAHRTPRLTIPNGAAATVTRLDPQGTVEIRLDRRPDRPLQLDPRRAPLPIDHGYAVTSHAAQGRTVHTVLATLDTRHRPELVNRQQLNVTLSRATHALHLFTDNRAALPATVDRAAGKTSALDLDLPLERNAPDAARQESIRPAPAPQPAPLRPRSGAFRGAAAPAPPARAAGPHAPGRPGPPPGHRGRPARTLFARDPHRDRHPVAHPGKLQPRRRTLRPPQPPRNPLRPAPRGPGGGLLGVPRHAADPGHRGAPPGPPRDPAGPAAPRLNQRLAAAWDRWQAWDARRAALGREVQTLEDRLAQLRATRPAAPGAARAIPVLAARLATLHSHLNALARARDPEELLARLVRQIGVSRVLALLPKPAAPVIQGLRLVTRALIALARDR